VISNCSVLVSWVGNEASPFIVGVELLQLDTAICNTCNCPELNDDWEVNMTECNYIPNDTASCDIGYGKLEWTPDLGSVVQNGSITCREFDFPDVSQIFNLNLSNPINVFDCFY
jgi:hypothetical protein